LFYTFFTNRIMQVPNFGSAIFLIGLSKWKSDNDFAGSWISNIYSEDEYWKGTRWFEYGQQESTMMTKTVASNVYESIPCELINSNFSSKFVGTDGKYEGFRDYEIRDRFSFSITSYDFEYNLRGQEVFFAISEPAPSQSNWEKMLKGCNYWESTITNYRGEIVGHRHINIFEDFFEVLITTNAGRQFAQEYARKVTKKKLTNCGGIEQLKKLFVTQDQSFILGDRNPQVSVSGIILDTQKPIGFHLDQARKSQGKK